MKNRRKQIVKRIMVSFLIVVLVMPILMQFTNTTAANSNYQFDEAEIIKAEQIANETGYDVDHILNLYGGGRDWNRVIELLTNNKQEGGNNDINLSQSMGSNDDLISQLSELGYSESDILEAKDMVEWVGYKLDEITTLTDDEAYSELKDFYNINDGVYWVLRLKDIKQSYLAALDEYLIALQLELDLNKLLEDEVQYELDKNEKTITLGEEPITTYHIDQKILELLSQGNKDSNEDDVQTVNSNEVTDPKEGLPETNTKIEVEDVKPVNPGDEIKEEIEALLPSID